jgi:hypothetical protein
VVDRLWICCRQRCPRSVLSAVAELLRKRVSAIVVIPQLSHDVRCHQIWPNLARNWLRRGSCRGLRNTSDIATQQRRRAASERGDCLTPERLQVFAERAHSRRVMATLAATTAAPFTIHLLPPLRRSKGSRLATGRKGGDCDPRDDQTQRNVSHDLPHFAWLWLWQCRPQRGKRTPALTRYFPMATIQAGNWWSTSWRCSVEPHCCRCRPRSSGALLRFRR